MLCSRHFRDSKERQDLSGYHDWNEALLGPSPTVDIYSIGGGSCVIFAERCTSTSTQLEPRTVTTIIATIWIQISLQILFLSITDQTLG
jgi:hypothetical protein